MKSEAGKHCYSPTISTLHPSTSPPCKMMESIINDLNASEEEVNQTQPRATCVIGSTVKAVADLPIQPASIGTPVRVADRPATENRPVEKEIDGEVFGMRLRYLRHNLWTPDADPLLTAAEWTLLADPLP